MLPREVPESRNNWVDTWERPAATPTLTFVLGYAFEIIQYFAAVSVFQLKPETFLRAATV